MLKFIGKILLWPFEHLAEIVMVALIIGLITTLQLLLFRIPEKYGDKIWLSNIILAFIIYSFTKTLNKKKDSSD